MLLPENGTARGLTARGLLPAFQKDWLLLNRAACSYNVAEKQAHRRNEIH